VAIPGGCTVLSLSTQHGPGPILALATRVHSGPVLAIPIRIGPGPVLALPIRVGPGPVLALPIRIGPGPVLAFAVGIHSGSVLRLSQALMNWWLKQKILLITKVSENLILIQNRILNISVVDPKLFFRIRIPFSAEFWIRLRILLD
jgi:hypothetical protein